MEYVVTAVALNATVPSRGTWLVQADCRAAALKLVQDQDTTHWWPTHTRWTVKPRPGTYALVDGLPVGAGYGRGCAAG